MQKICEISHTHRHTAYLILILISKQILRGTIKFVFTEPFPAKWLFVVCIRVLQLKNLAQKRLQIAKTYIGIKNLPFQRNGI